MLHLVQLLLLLLDDLLQSFLHFKSAATSAIFGCYMMVIKRWGRLWLFYCLETRQNRFNVVLRGWQRAIAPSRNYMINEKLRISGCWHVRQDPKRGDQEELDRMTLPNISRVWLRSDGTKLQLVPPGFICATLWRIRFHISRRPGGNERLLRLLLRPVLNFKCCAHDGTWIIHCAEEILFPMKKSTDLTMTMTATAGAAPAKLTKGLMRCPLWRFFTRRRSATGHAQKLRPRWNVGEIEKAANLIFSGFTSSRVVYLFWPFHSTGFLFKCMFRGGLCRVAISAEWPLTADQLIVTKLVSVSLFFKKSPPTFQRKCLKNNFVTKNNWIPPEHGRHVIDSCCSSQCGGGDLIRS